eukprot:766870-Hanusia_phi.AAC.1
MVLPGSYHPAAPQDSDRGPAEGTHHARTITSAIAAQNFRSAATPDPSGKLRLTVKSAPALSQ